MSGLNTGYGRNLSQSKMKIFLPHIKRFCAVLKSVFKFKRPTLFADLGTSPFSEGDSKFHRRRRLVPNLLDCGRLPLKYVTVVMRRPSHWTLAKNQTAGISLGVPISTKYLP